MTEQIISQRLAEAIADGREISDDLVNELAVDHVRAMVEQAVSEHKEAAAAKRRHSTRQSEIGKQLRHFERDVDALIDRMTAAAVAFESSCVELEAVQKTFDELLRDYRDKLHRLGWEVLDPSDVFSASGYRVILARDMLQRMKLHRVDGTVRILPDAERYAAWARDQRAERDGHRG